MLRRGASRLRDTLRRCVPVALAACMQTTAAAQESPQSPPNPNGPSTLRVWRDVAGSSLRDNVAGGVRQITLSDAQQAAQTAADPLRRLGELKVEAARQHRLGVKSMYLPNVSTQV